MIELLQRQDEEAMASSGALPGSMLRQKWLHVIQARRPMAVGLHALLPQLCSPRLLLLAVGQRMLWIC